MVLADVVARMKDMLDAISNLLDVDLVVWDAFPPVVATSAKPLLMACPIKLGDRVVGGIGYTSRDPAGKGVPAQRPREVENLLKQVADLISAKLLDQENLVQKELMAEEVETLLDSVDRSIIAVDNNGQILRYNKKAMKLFRIKEGEPFTVDMVKLVGEPELKHLLTNCRRAKSQEFIYREGHQTVRGLYDSNPICIDGRNHGIVFTLSEFSDVLRIVNNVTVGNIATDFEQILGNSQSILSIKQAAEKAALTSSTVLIQGESGTGKELFARAIHFHSERARGPFIPINCSAIPEQLIESELFGYADGAFTGARKGGKAGKFELAHQGTLLLDEIGDMQLHLQAKLLRVLQERVIEKVGGKEYIPIDVRVIAATNKDLEAKMLLGEFRQDLFYRLNVIPLTIPPLRDRPGDVPLLVRSLLKKCSGKLGKRICDIEPEALAVLEAYPWPGNVRELENTVEYASNMCSGVLIEFKDLPARIRVQGTRTIQDGGFKGSLDQMERREIEKAISEQLASGKSSLEIAQALGISRATLYRKFKKYGLRRSHIETIVSY